MDERVTLRLYVTRSVAAEVSRAVPCEYQLTKSESIITTTTADQEKENVSGAHKAKVSALSVASCRERTSDSEPTSPSDGVVTSIAHVQVVYRRPDVAELIRTTIDETSANKRVLVMGCGPDGLMQTIRNTTACCIRSEGPAVELYGEQFGW